MSSQNLFDVKVKKNAKGSKWEIVATGATVEDAAKVAQSYMAAGMLAQSVPHKATSRVGRPRKGLPAFNHTDKYRVYFYVSKGSNDPKRMKGYDDILDGSRVSAAIVAIAQNFDNLTKIQIVNITSGAVDFVGRSLAQSVAKRGNVDTRPIKPADDSKPDHSKIESLSGERETIRGDLRFYEYTAQKTGNHFWAVGVMRDAVPDKAQRDARIGLLRGALVGLFGSEGSPWTRTARPAQAFNMTAQELPANLSFDDFVNAVSTAMGIAVAQSYAPVAQDTTDVRSPKHKKVFVESTANVVRDLDEMHQRELAAARLINAGQMDAAYRLLGIAVA